MINHQQCLAAGIGASPPADCSKCAGWTSPCSKVVFSSLTATATSARHLTGGDRWCSKSFAGGGGRPCRYRCTGSDGRTAASPAAAATAAGKGKASTAVRASDSWAWPDCYSLTVGGCLDHCPVSSTQAAGKTFNLALSSPAGLWVNFAFLPGFPPSGRAPTCLPCPRHCCPQRFTCCGGMASAAGLASWARSRAFAAGPGAWRSVSSWERAAGRSTAAPGCSAAGPDGAHSALPACFGFGARIGFMN